VQSFHRAVHAHSRRQHSVALLGALALVLFEEALANEDGLRRDLEQLVVRDELRVVLEREWDGRGRKGDIPIWGAAEKGTFLSAPWSPLSRPRPPANANC
jgi:hypothetical protein